MEGNTSILHTLPKDMFKHVFGFCNEKTFDQCLENYALPRIALLHPKYSHGKAVEYFTSIGDLSSVQILLRIQSSKSTLDSALIIASLYGHLEIVKYLVSLGTNIHIYGEYYSPLYNVSRKGHLKIAQYLVSLGVDIHADNERALYYASTDGHLNVVQYLVEKGANIHADNERALYYASTDGHLNVVQYLVEKGANIHADNERALRSASMYGRLTIVKYLVSMEPISTLMTIGLYN